jgi:hypothetical protein
MLWLLLRRSVVASFGKAKILGLVKLLLFYARLQYRLAVASTVVSVAGEAVGFLAGVSGSRTTMLLTSPRLML